MVAKVRDEPLLHPTVRRDRFKRIKVNPTMSLIAFLFSGKSLFLLLEKCRNYFLSHASSPQLVDIRRLRSFNRIMGAHRLPRSCHFLRNSHWWWCTTYRSFFYRYELVRCFEGMIMRCCCYGSFALPDLWRCLPFFSFFSDQVWWVSLSSLSSIWGLLTCTTYSPDDDDI